MSFEDRVEPARLRLEAAIAQAEKSDDVQVHRKAAEAYFEFDGVRGHYLPETDMELHQGEVVSSLKGVDTRTVFMFSPGSDEPLVDQDYLVFGDFFMMALDRRFMFAKLWKPVERARLERRLLDETLSSTYGGVVFGSLSLASFEKPTTSALAGVRVRIASNGFAFDTFTDQQGIFLVTGVPLGRVSVTPALDDHLVVPSRFMTAELEDQKCTPFRLRAVFNGRIRGRVSGSDGRAKPNLEVQVSPKARGHHTAARSEFTVRTNDKGEFEFTALPPGEYLLGYDLRPGSDVIMPIVPGQHPPTFFPGTVDRRSAVPITVGQGTVHEGFDFRVDW